MNYRSPSALPAHVIVLALTRRLVRMAESAGTVFILLLFSDGILELVLHGGPNWPDGTAASGFERASSWLAYLFTLLQVAIRPREILRAAARNPFVPGVVFIAFLSVAWSDDPNWSLLAASRLALLTLFGLYLGSRFTTQELLVHLGWALGILAVLSLGFGLFAPDYGLVPGPNGGAWRGVFTTKNVLGEMMLIASIVFSLLARSRGGHRRLATMGALLGVGLIVLARANGALLIAIAIVAIMPTLVVLRRGGAASVLALCGLLALGATAGVAIGEREAVLSALGKDATLTGRTALWAAVGERIMQRPALGYGYRAFWEQTHGASERVRAVVGWDAPHSHNSFLDLWLDVGLVGLLCFVAGFFVAIRNAWLSLRACVGLEGLWAMGFLVMLLLGNITESSVYQNSLIWTLFVAVASLPSRSSRSDAGPEYTEWYKRGSA